MILSFLGSLASNVLFLFLFLFLVYYIYNKKSGKVKDIKDGIVKFISEIKEIPSKVTDLLNKLEEIKKKLDNISKL